MKKSTGKIIRLLDEFRIAVFFSGFNPKDKSAVQLNNLAQNFLEKADAIIETERMKQLVRKEIVIDRIEREWCILGCKCQTEKVGKCLLCKKKM